ncbi:SMI1/KNR4 family protein [Amycolatopsis anabasis]|uniref:SMI1/KNR4 family protein n=1 Tax=Amycolatopsis anabasis TaxID=1840409 RepID=UPI00131EAC5C|nr:SMI1/KNR4 family protein [Amycolatopsis anabasis]
MTSALDQLLARSRGPTGQPRIVEFGTTSGPLGELATLLTARNGFFVFNAGIQIFRAGDPGLGPELQAWNRDDSWKNTYAGLADDLWCFGQDLFGVQFGLDQHHRRVVRFDPETGTRTTLGDSLHDWAAWLLDEPDLHGCRAFATAWQHHHGPLDYDQRLIPWRPFVLHGTYEFANLTTKPAATCMRIRGPIAQHIHNTTDGTPLHLQAR